MAFLFFGEDVLRKIKMDRNFLVSVLIFAVSLAVSPSAFAWFFVIPGSVTRSISDAITGEEGFHCVGRAAKVGDVIQTSTGPGIVKSLSGESSRCSTNLNRPIRALLVPGEGVVAADGKTVVSKPLTSMPPATSNARLELSDDWQQKPLVAGQDAKVIVLFAVNKTTNTALTLGTIKRSELGDIAVYAKTRQVSLAAALTDTKLSPIEPIKVGQLPAWRYTVSGNSKKGNAWTYMVTIYEGRDEVVIVNTWTLAANFELQQSEMHRIEDGISGIEPPI